MPNRSDCCFTRLSQSEIEQILAAYQTQSQTNVCKQFNITKYALLRIIKNAGVVRSRYGSERNNLVSKGIKKTLLENPTIVIERVQKYHLGVKRSKTSRKKMQEAAWLRMQNNPTNFISKIETLFGSNLAKKFDVKMVPQFRVENKPFDFLCENKLLIEFDGPHHYDDTYFLWKGEPNKFKKQQQRDCLRQEIAHRNGYKLLVIQQKQVDRCGRLCDDSMHLIMKELGYQCA